MRILPASKRYWGSLSQCCFRSRVGKGRRGRTSVHDLSVVFIIAYCMLMGYGSIKLANSFGASTTSNTSNTRLVSHRIIPGAVCRTVRRAAVGACGKDYKAFSLLFARPSVLEDETASTKHGERAATPVTRYHALILPGFGNASIDYTMPNSLVSSLSRRWNSKLNKGRPPTNSKIEVVDGNSRKSIQENNKNRNVKMWSGISVLPVKRIEWINVFVRGIFDFKFWLADASPTRPAFRWYLDKIVSEVNRIVLTEGEQHRSSNVHVVLICHSAGGWLARAALGFLTGNANDHHNGNTHVSNIKNYLDHVIGIVTLGTPHTPPPAEVMDMTRGALRITHETFPGAFYSPSIFYVTVIGNSIKGKEQKRRTPLEPTTLDGFAYKSYQIVCGKGDAFGDGVVPIDAAHLDDAIQLELDGVQHSINAPENWYGSDGVIDGWLNVVIKEIEAATNRKSVGAFDKVK